ncbi:MAG: MerR family transcriptional regulator [Candidatus Schekmanbacteria bacterium]|nr:MAG: MerR family transcriptional regulator [Candidatus Schekmanbacteria bacterium]
MKKRIPDKLFYKIGETSEIAGLPPHVLRFWENEFKCLNPGKNRTGQRVYTRRDLEIILRIKELLYEEKYTIAGAQKRLAKEFGKGRKPAADSKEVLIRVKKELKNLLRELS